MKTWQTSRTFALDDTFQKCLDREELPDLRYPRYEASEIALAGLKGISRLTKEALNALLRLGIDNKGNGIPFSINGKYVVNTDVLVDSVYEVRCDQKLSKEQEAALAFGAGAVVTFFGLNELYARDGITDGSYAATHPYEASQQVLRDPNFEHPATQALLSSLEKLGRVLMPIISVVVGVGYLVTKGIPKIIAIGVSLGTNTIITGGQIWKLGTDAVRKILSNPTARWVAAFVIIVAVDLALLAQLSKIEMNYIYDIGHVNFVDVLPGLRFPCTDALRTTEFCDKDGPARIPDGDIDYTSGVVHRKLSAIVDDFEKFEIWWERTFSFESVSLYLSKLDPLSTFSMFDRACSFNGVAYPRIPFNPVQFMLNLNALLMEHVKFAMRDGSGSNEIFETLALVKRINDTVFGKSFEAELKRRQDRRASQMLMLDMYLMPGCHY